MSVPALMHSALPVEAARRQPRSIVNRNCIEAPILVLLGPIFGGRKGILNRLSTEVGHVAES